MTTNHPCQETQHKQQSAFQRHLQQRLPGKKRLKANLIDTVLHEKGVISYLMMLNCTAFLVSLMPVCINMHFVWQEQRGFNRNSLKTKVHWSCVGWMCWARQRDVQRLRLSCH